MVERAYAAIRACHSERVIPSEKGRLPRDRSAALGRADRTYCPLQPQRDSIRAACRDGSWETAEQPAWRKLGVHHEYAKSFLAKRPR